jgi:hypothetical protein
MAYDQLEKILTRAAFDLGFREQLVRAGSSAKQRFAMDSDEGRFIDALLRDGGAGLRALLNVIHHAGIVALTSGVVVSIGPES